MIKKMLLLVVIGLLFNSCRANTPEDIKNPDSQEQDAQEQNSDENIYHDKLFRDLDDWSSVISLLTNNEVTSPPSGFESLYFRSNGVIDRKDGLPGKWYFDNEKKELCIELEYFGKVTKTIYRDYIWNKQYEVSNGIRTESYYIISLFDENIGSITEFRNSKSQFCGGHDIKSYRDKWGDELKGYLFYNVYMTRHVVIQQ